jgi:hypothetical protein
MTLAPISADICQRIVTTHDLVRLSHLGLRVI